MATPTSGEIRERAFQIFMSEGTGRGAYEEGGGAPPTPEDRELREGGYFERARIELMRESANLTPEQKEAALARKEELKAELAEVREALGYRPRAKREKVEALVEAAKSPEQTAAVAGTVEVASREELEAPTVEVPEVTPDIEENLATSAVLVPRPERRERYPGRYIGSLATQRQPIVPAVEGPKPPPAHKQLSASFRKAFRSTTRRLSDYEKELAAQDQARRKREAEERRELQMFAREVNLAKRKRIILARATADVERERASAEQGFGSGETPIRGLAKAVSRRVGRIGAPQIELAPDGLENINPEEEPQDLSPYGTNFGRFPSHRYPAYRFASARRTNRLHFRLGEPKPGARPSKGPRIRTSWSFDAALKGVARSPSYTKGKVPYSFELVRPEDRDLRQAQGRISE